jgi:carboxymethylenebutenolidase
MTDKSKIPAEAVELYTRFIHGEISRRAFVSGVKGFAVAGLTSATLIEALMPKYAEAQQIRDDDNRIKTSWETVPSPDGNGSIKGYLVRPISADTRSATPAKLPGVIVIHENRGLNPHIEDIARRMALADFVAFAPDALFPLGGYPGDEDKARAAFGQLDSGKTREDMVAAATWLKNRPDCTGKIGAVGFCWGGGMVNFLATRLPDLNAGVPFYGTQPSAEETARIKTPLLIHYAENDDRVNAGWPAFDAALKEHNVPHEMFKYPGTQHGFNNDTTPRYDAAAAKQAWERTVAFFNKQLR